MTKIKPKNQPQELIFGIHPIIELLKAKRRKLQTIYTTKPAPKAWSKIASLLPSYVQIQYVDRAILSKLAGTDDHQGIVAYSGLFSYRRKFFDPRQQPFLIMLDGIQDPKNLGAILRTAYCTKVDGVILTVQNAAPLTAAALKASAGLAEHLEILVANSASAALQQLKQAGYQPYLMTVDDSTDATKIEYKFPLCIVIGNEGSGISKAIINSGEHITLPQRQADISYNASVAAGLIMFHIANKNQIL